MQIIHSTSPTNKKESCAQSKEIVLSNHRGANQRQKRVEKISLGCKNFNLFTILRRRDITKTCFYSTLNLETVHTMKMMKKEDIARGLGLSNNKGADSAAAHVGNTKVLPISDAALSSSQCAHANEEKKEQKVKSDKTKTLSKMKELLRWAAATKAEKGGKYISRKVLHFRNRAALKSVPDADQLSNDSPKISFRWDVESCSTTSSSVYSALSMASSTRINIDQNMNLPPPLNSTPIHDNDHSTTKTGNWITTDSEFVVLEL